MTVAIIGASQAGLQIAASLRGHGHDGPILLIGDEPYAPYQRPPLSKGYVKGLVTEDMLMFRDPGFYEQQAITLITGERVVNIERQGRELETHNGRRIRFDQLAIATGARARRLAIEGADLPGVLSVRDLDDARALAQRLATGTRLVVIGGGFVGLEVAAMAADLGKDVVVLEAADRLMGRSLGPPVAEFVLAAHRRRGLDIRLGVQIRRLVGDAQGVQGLELGNGERIPADVVVTGIGSTVSADLPCQLRLAFSQGIVVDSAARTSVPEIVAAGDCTVRSLEGGEVLRLESVHNAIEQGKAAAASLLGLAPPLAAAPWFWSDQGKLKLQMAGLCKGFDDFVVRGDMDSEKFSVFYFREGLLTAAESVNSPGDHLTTRKLMARKLRIAPAEWADVSIPLKTFLTHEEPNAEITPCE